MKTASQFFSWLLHPLFIVTYATLIYFFILPLHIMLPQKLVLYIIGVVFIGTVFLPLMSALLLLKFGRVKSLQLTQQQERNMPILQTLIVYAGCVYLLQPAVVPIFVKAFLYGTIPGLFLALLINRYAKISLHMIGIGGLCGGLTALGIISEGDVSSLLLAGIFILAGVLGTARLVLDSHKPSEILMGFVLGFFSEFLVLIFWR